MQIPPSMRKLTSNVAFLCERSKSEARQSITQRYWTKCLDWSILYAASACVVHLKRNAANAQSARLLLSLDSRIATCERVKRNNEKSDGVMFVSPWNSKL